MPVFEILITAQSVILGFACARILHSTSIIFSKSCDFKIYLTWYNLVLTIFISFWTSINLSRVVEYDFLDFSLLMIYQGLIFIMCDSMFPTNSDKISSWDDHYLKYNQIYWFCNFACAIVITIQMENYFITFLVISIISLIL